MDGGTLRVRLDEQDADSERLDRLTGLLRRELLQLDVADVIPLPGAEPPRDARAVDVAALGGLLVTLGKSAKGLRGVVAALRTWLAGGNAVARTVRLEIDGDVLELSGATSADQERLVSLFVNRHSTE